MQKEALACCEGSYGTSHVERVIEGVRGERTHIRSCTAKRALFAMIARSEMVPKGELNL